MQLTERVHRPRAEPPTAGLSGTHWLDGTLFCFQRVRTKQQASEPKPGVAGNEDKSLGL